MQFPKFGVDGLFRCQTFVKNTAVALNVSTISGISVWLILTITILNNDLF